MMNVFLFTLFYEDYLLQLCSVICEFQYWFWNSGFDIFLKR